MEMRVILCVRDDLKPDDYRALAEKLVGLNKSHRVFPLMSWVILDLLEGEPPKPFAAAMQEHVEGPIEYDDDSGERKDYGDLLSESQKQLLAEMGHVANARLILLTQEGLDRKDLVGLLRSEIPRDFLFHGVVDGVSLDED